MSTSEIALGPGLPGGGVPTEPLAQPPVTEGEGIGRLLERLANEYFAGVPGPALELGRQSAPGLPLAVGGGPAPGPVAAPTGVFPSAVAPSALGVSPGSGWVPPAPGFMQQPPIASGPLPDEADLRTAPAMLSELTGISSPVGLARGAEPSSDAPMYFLDIAGLGKPSSPQGVSTSAALPGAATGSSLAPAAPPSGIVPSAATPGAGGVSPGAGWVPPAPGFLHQAPTPSSPPPTENDLRTGPSVASEGLGFSLPLGLAPELPASSAGAPYFLDIAGLPKPPAAGAPALPAAVSSPSGSIPSTPGAAPAPGAAQSATTTQPAASAPLPVGSEGTLAPSTTLIRDGGYPYGPNEVALTPFAESVESGGLDSRKLDRGGRRMFDAASVRRDFPILQERVHNKELIWFDNAATTQKPRAVIERLEYFYEHENSNIHRAAHTLAARSTDAYEGSRETVRRFINAPSVNEIVFVRGTTEGINLVAQSWGRRYLSSGDEVVITWLEHHANIVPWQQICSERGARLRVAPVDDQGQVLLYEYEKLLSTRTKFVSMSHVSNALGTIVPVQEMVSMAHRHGAKVLVDGAQAVSHQPVDVQAIDCDFYVFSGHKIFGPTGIGAVFGKAEVLETMPPWQGGGNMIRDVTFEKTQFQGPPARFEAGTPNIADAVGLGAALDYVTSLGIENIALYEHELLEYATGCLLSIPGLHLYGTAPHKAGVLSFTIDGLKTEDIGVALDREGIAVRAGHHCAQPILRRFGQEATVRASLAPYNTYGDVDALVAALKRLLVLRY